MYRTASRFATPRILPSIRSSARQRFLSTAPPSQKTRSWKSSAVRWGLAIGGIYYYNASNVFAEEPTYSTLQSPSLTNDASPPTLDSISASRHSANSSSPSVTPIPPPANSTAASLDESPTTSPADPPRTPEEYEEEAVQQGAFNEETGEINWDCPCLGGMAHGPCGEEFRAAFSCFVFSKEEPKGMDCIDNFKGMQDCFRRHPEIYGSELDDDDEDSEQSADQPTDTAASDTIPSVASPQISSSPSSSSSSAPETSEDPEAITQRAKAATKQVSQDHSAQDESEHLVPKAAHDATTANTEK